MPGALNTPEAAAAAAVRARIDAACRRAGRDPASLTLIAASKTVPAGRVAASGVADVGENRVQELLAKQDALRDRPIRWHLIGTLQRNKARKVAGRVALVHSLSSIALCEALDRAAHDAGVVQDALVEVNLGGEPTKAGVAEHAADGLVEAARSMRSIRVLGLMTVPPPGPPEDARPLYRRLAALAERLALPELSMGMSGDFEVAVEEGATFVRVGSAIFGTRSG